MAVEAVVGQVLKTIVNELLKEVGEVVVKSREFRPLYKRLETTLNQIASMLEVVENLNTVVNRDRDDTKLFTDKLTEGKTLVKKCARVRCWNLWQKSSYAKKLENFDNELVRFFQVDVAAANFKELRILGARVDRDGSRHGATIMAGRCRVPEVKGIVVGLDEPVRVVKEMVVTTSGEEKVVVVTAPAGCGKTTLAKRVCHDPDVTGKFKDNIFFVIASHTPNLSGMIEMLFQHKGFLESKFSTDEVAINQLEIMLKLIGPNPILLVLDDVWPGLESFIENLAIQVQEIKILVTSRHTFPRFKSTYKLKPLNHKDAMELFRRSASPQDGSSYIHDHDVLVNKVVKNCCGFPQALIVVGRSLYGKPKEIWKWTLKQWSEGASLFSSSENGILIHLQTSVNSLHKVHKECYLDLASFPEDKNIPVSALIDMWVGLYNLDEDEDAIAHLQELSMRTLVDYDGVTRKDASESNHYYNEHFAMQHDLLRELAIHLCSQEDKEKRKRLIIEIKGNDFPRWLIEQGEHSPCARLVSLSTDESFSSDWLDMQLPEVEVLVLNIKSRKYVLPEFMKKMDQLKVLIITNYNVLPSKIKSIPLLGYLSGLKRIRFEKVLIPSISDSILSLRNLQKISFIMCDISKAFHNCPIQISDILPNLSEIVIDCCYDLAEFPGFLCEVRSLKELIISKCHELLKISEDLGKLENLKVLRVRDCTKLLKLPETIGRLKKLDFLDISDCKGLSTLPGQMGDLCDLTVIDMRGCWGLSELPMSIKDLKKLKKVTCDEENEALWSNTINNLKIEVHKEDAS